MLTRGEILTFKRLFKHGKEHEIIGFILQHHIDVNSCPLGTHLIFSAIQAEMFELFVFIINHKDFDPNVKSFYGHSIIKFILGEYKIGEIFNPINLRKKSNPMRKFYYHYVNWLKNNDSIC